jgi:hypothetical protein
MVMMRDGWVNVQVKNWPPLFLGVAVPLLSDFRLVGSRAASMVAHKWAVQCVSAAEIPPATAVAGRLERQALFGRRTSPHFCPHRNVRPTVLRNAG